MMFACVRARLVMGILLLGGALCGCTTHTSRPWGDDLTPLPSMDRLGWAFERAATDPHTWVPLAGAAVFAIGGFDEDVSDWARRRTPVFGSRENANDYGDLIRDITIGGAFATALAAPSGSTPEEILPNKFKGLAVQVGAAITPQWVSKKLKQGTNRVRPNERDDLSFPSTRSAETAAWAAMGRRNADSFPIARPYRVAIDGGFTSLAALSAWSRVENGSHWPSDTLFGIALGNFVSRVIRDGMLGPSWRDCCLGLAPSSEGFALSFSTKF